MWKVEVTENNKWGFIYGKDAQESIQLVNEVTKRRGRTINHNDVEFGGERHSDGVVLERGNGKMRK